MVLDSPVPSPPPLRTAQRPLVSVVIPSFNHARFVEATIESVLTQSLSDLELIVIDDGSADDTVARIERKLGSSRDPRARLVVREHLGLCRILNQGLLQARGHFFAYLGSDDLWESTKLEKQVAALEKEGKNAGAAFADCYIIDAEGRRLGRFGTQYEFRGGDIYRDLVLMRFHPASPTNLFVRHKLLAAGGFNEAIPIEDRDAWLRLARHYRVAYLPEPLASFRLHSTNTHKYFDRMERSNQYTFDWAFRTDPALISAHRRIRGAFHTGRAAAHYIGLDLGGARHEAMKALVQYPFDRIAWRIMIRSCLGRTIIDRARRLRRRKLNGGLSK